MTELSAVPAYNPYLARLQETDLQAFIEHLRCDRPLKVASVNGYVAALHGLNLRRRPPFNLEAWA